MKLTQSNNANNADFFRNTEKGQLILKNQNSDHTYKIIEKLPLKKSLIYRMLYKPSLSDLKNKQNPFYIMIESLVEESISINIGWKHAENNILVTLDGKTIVKSKDEFQAIISAKLSKYAICMHITGQHKTLSEMLLDYYDGKNIDDELKKLKEHIHERINRKRRRLEYSIKNNRIPFSVDNDLIQINSKKMKLLFSFLSNDGVNLTRFSEFQTDYRFSDLLAEINALLNNHNEAQFPSRKIYKIVSDYDYKFRCKYDNCDKYLLYATELRKYFYRLFIANKATNKKADEINALNYSSEKYIFSQVKRYIVNQLVAGLIQYGKIYHYCCENKIFDNNVTSDTLSYIQVEEAFKKQLFLSISWAIAKLNYFCDYASQNNLAINDGLSSDILSYYIDNKSILFNKLFEQSHIKGLREKIAAYFNINNPNLNVENPDSDNAIKILLEQTFESVNEIRNNSFHYNKETIIKAVNNNQDIPDIITSLFSRDIGQIQENFKEQIRSSGIAEYYSCELLISIFKGTNIKFELYAPQYPMTPSFKKLYKRGCNISKASRKDEKISWMIELDSSVEKDGQTAYKNFLQLIYYHSFLPAICSDDGEKLITSFIEKTKQWNKENSITEQKINNSKNEKEKAINERKFRYADMPDYRSEMTMAQYLQNLQRLQSARENDDDSTIANKGNYYLDFVQDVFLLAFDNFIDSKFLQFKYKLTNPARVTNLSCSDVPATTIDTLFRNDNPILRMETTLQNGTEYLGWYPFLRILDQRQINELLHQIIRYRSSLESRKYKPAVNFSDLRKLEELVALVQFTIPIQSVDGYYKTAMTDYFRYFFDNKDPGQYDDMYYQSDKVTPVLHRSMSLTARSGAIALYKMMFSGKYKITFLEFAGYKKQISDNNILQTDSIPDIIKDNQKQLQELHKELVTLHPKKSHDLSAEQYDKINNYRELLTKTSEYENLRHKMTFENLYRVHQVHIDILARFAAFAEDWERDMFFMLTALKCYGKISFDVVAVFHEGNIIKKLGKELKNNTGKLFFELCWPNDSIDVKNLQRRLFCRNSVAHLNHLTQTKINGNIPQLNIYEMMNKLRMLLAYDIKRQNSVTQSVIELLKKQHKIILKLKPKKFNSQSGSSIVEFEKDKLYSDRIIHLKNLKTVKRISVNANSDEMIKLVDTLLEYKLQ